MARLSMPLTNIEHANRGSNHTRKWNKHEMWWIKK